MTALLLGAVVYGVGCFLAGILTAVYHYEGNVSATTMRDLRARWRA